jgi:hypothetical protein
MDCNCLFTVKYSWSEKGSQAFIRNPALPLEQNVYLYDTHPIFFPLQVGHRKFK